MKNNQKRRWTFFKSIDYSFRVNRESAGSRVYVHLFLGFLAASLELLAIYIFKEIIDCLIATRELADFLLLIASYFAILLGLKVCYSLRTINVDIMRNKAEHKYEQELLERIANIPLAIIDSSEGRDYINYLQDAKSFAITLVYRISDVASLSYAFIVALIAFSSYSMIFTGIFIIIALPGIIMEVTFGKKIDTLIFNSRPDVRRFCYYRWLLTDRWPAKDVRMYDLSDSFKKRYDEEKEDYRKANSKLDLSELKAKSVTELIMRAGELSFLVYAVVICIRGKITIGTVTYLVGLSLTLIQSLRDLLSIVVATSAYSERLMGRFFDFKQFEKQEPFGNKPIEGFESLEFDNVTFTYPFMEKPVLEGISFKVNRGDKVFLVGVNGAGKSTIIKLLLGLYRVDSGKILVNGTEISEYKKDDLNRLFAVLFQNFVQYSLSVRDNVALCNFESADDENKIISVLKEVGLYDDILSRIGNRGLDAPMTRKFDDEGIELSKGQWQKIALARAFYKNADVIVLDEPSAALDAEAEDMIFQKMGELSEAKTSIMISHRISNAKTASVIMVLENGKIIEKGSHEELISLGGVYSKLFNLQRKKYIKEGEPA